MYFAQMSMLQNDFPDVYNHFQAGGFSVQLGDRNPFCRIPLDQTIEETANKDTQTAGGTRGFSLRPGAVSRYYLTAEHRSISLRQLRKMTRMQRPGQSHADLEPSKSAGMRLMLMQ